MKMLPSPRCIALLRAACHFAGGRSSTIWHPPPLVLEQDRFQAVHNQEYLADVVGVVIFAHISELVIDPTRQSPRSSGEVARETVHIARLR